MTEIPGKHIINPPRKNVNVNTAGKLLYKKRDAVKNEYLFESKDFPSWHDKIDLSFGLIRLSWIITPISAGIILELLCLLISFVFGIQTLYIKTYQIHFLIFTLVGVYSCFLWGKIELLKILSIIQPCFTMSKDEYKMFVSGELKKIYNYKILFIPTLCMIFLIDIPMYLYVISNYPILSNTISWLSGSYIQAKYFILFFSTTLSIIVFSTGIVEIIMIMIMLSGVFKSDIKISPNIASLKFKIFSNYILKITGVMFFNATLVGMTGFFYTRFVIIFWEAFAILCGVAWFAVPHYYMHKLLVKRREQLLSNLEEEILETEFFEFNKMKIMRKEVLYYSAIESFYHNQLTASVWPFNLSLLIQFISLFFIPILGNILQVAIRNIVK